jgi:23S rRNA (cytidine1920-2'-O)/16S rRNA (cytidine1409-2'-O)-methyltransferase
MKERADLTIFKNKLTRSRNEAVQLIEGGYVYVDDKKISKPSQKINNEAKIEIRTTERYVGRGAFKLISALDAFKLNPANQVCLDVGSSTGGFTEVLLQRGASKIYSVDVCSNQLANSLRNNPKVQVMENTDIRNINDLVDKPTLAVIDVSFISLEKILPAVKKLLSERGQIIALVKPQFEVGKEHLGKKGVVKEIEWQNWAKQKIKDFALTIGLNIQGEIKSPILGGDGNNEFLLLLTNNISII